MTDQNDAVRAIVSSLQKDSLVEAVFLKGSMGRGEEDIHSDVDLYCFVDKENETAFLKNRLEHLRAYREILFYEDLFIVAPQIITVYDNLLHVDLLTVHEESFLNKDFFKVLYDPKDRLKMFESAQTLELTRSEFDEEVYDTAWFLFRYEKAVKRGDSIWAVSMLHEAIKNLAKVLLHQYRPDRAQLGLKALLRGVPDTVGKRVEHIFSLMTPAHHKDAVSAIIVLLEVILPRIKKQCSAESQGVQFLSLMISNLKRQA